MKKRRYNAVEKPCVKLELVIDNVFGYTGGKMSGYMTYIDHTKDADAKKKSESPKSLPNRSDFLGHKRRVPDRTDISMEDMRIHYRSNQTVIQMYPIHPSFKAESYRDASRSTRLGRHARELQRELEWELLNRRVGNIRVGNIGVSNSDVLRAALVEDNGVPDSRIVRNYSGINYAIGNQAHHIVETHNTIGQEILRNAGIHSNSAANGVLLPVAEGDGRGNAAIHNGSHNGEYTACVNEALVNATAELLPYIYEYRERVINVLSEIRRILLNNNMALNSRGDADYKDDSPNGKKSIRDIFQEQGLI